MIHNLPFIVNQNLRYWYIDELLKKEDMKQFRYLLHSYGISVNVKTKRLMVAL